MSQQSIDAFDYMTEEQRTDVLLRGETVDVRLALKAGTDYALSVNKALFLPDGTYSVLANNGSSTGWDLALTTNKSLMVFGNGRGMGR